MAEITIAVAAALPGKWEYYNYTDAAWYTLGKQQAGGTEFIREMITKPIKYNQRGDINQGHIYRGWRIAFRMMLREFSGQIEEKINNGIKVTNACNTDAMKFSHGYGSGVPIGKNLIANTVPIRFTPDTGLGSASNLRILATACQCLGDFGFVIQDSEEMGRILTFEAQWNENATQYYEVLFFGHTDYEPATWDTPVVPSTP